VLSARLRPTRDRGRDSVTPDRILILAAMLVLASCSSGNGDDNESAEQSAAAPSVEQVASAGCDVATPVTTVEEEVTFDSAGTERWYIRHVPPAHDGLTPLPLVVDFHGYLEGAVIHTGHSELGTYGDEQGFVTVTPQGAGAVPRWDTALDSADVEFVGNLLDDVESTLCIDRNRIYVTGLSNGAFMSSALACAYSERIAAAAPVAGIRDIDGCDPQRAVPVIAFHGTDDRFVTYDGSFGEAVRDLPAPDGSGRTLGEGTLDTSAQGPSVPEITGAWAARNDCEAEPSEEAVADDVTLLRYRCPEGSEVLLYRVDGGGHSWPGSAFSQNIANVVGATTTSISANELMWEFFEERPLPADG